ncbi:hypothetical protein [Caminibacter mediatlanticus]|uniref:Uncharacterized protein n=1 Tax=Caminibacter mediatlanticus TB-2 TaxID=391592 RepID=A0AAI9F1Q4_9BACT|nr:hypothetical protein [Caminibacter mediatlanticus]EDM22955.1 hypothetical protein CMTB2_05602 [Caminibacter mediatlanticus TB-2]
MRVWIYSNKANPHSIIHIGLDRNCGNLFRNAEKTYNVAEVTKICDNAIVFKTSEEKDNSYWINYYVGSQNKNEILKKIQNDDCLINWLKSKKLVTTFDFCSC